MRYIMTFVWAILVSSVISYVLTNMGDEPFNMVHALILAVIMTVLVFVLGEGLIKTEKAEQ